MLLRVLVSLTVVAVLGDAPNIAAQVGSRELTTIRPARREFTVPGIMAWSFAKDQGWQFKPLGCTGWDGRAQEVSRTGYVTDYCRIHNPPDGVNTIWQRWTSTCLPFSPCVWAGMDNVASIVGGNMNIYKTQMTVDFLYFDRYKLAPGWTIKNVDLYAGSFARRPAYGTNNMSFVVRLRSYGYPASAHVRAVTLEGPATAASWQDAFR